MKPFKNTFLASVLLLQIVDSFSDFVEVKLDEIDNDKCGSKNGWSFVDFTNLPVDIGSSSTGLRASSFSCALVDLDLSPGILDVTVYVKNGSDGSRIEIVVSGDDTSILNYAYSKSNEDFEEGWHRISLPINKYISGNVLLLGFSQKDNIILIDSIKFRINDYMSTLPNNFEDVQIMDHKDVNTEENIDYKNSINVISPRKNSKTVLIEKNDHHFNEIQTDKNVINFDKPGKVQIIDIIPKNNLENNDDDSNKHVKNIIYFDSSSETNVHSNENSIRNSIYNGGAEKENGDGITILAATNDDGVNEENVGETTTLAPTNENSGEEDSELELTTVVTTDGSGEEEENGDKTTILAATDEDGGAEENGGETTILVSTDDNGGDEDNGQELTTLASTDGGGEEEENGDKTTTLAAMDEDDGEEENGEGTTTLASTDEDGDEDNGQETTTVLTTEENNNTDEQEDIDEKPIQSSSFWNIWTIVLVSVGSATVAAIVIVSAYYLGKKRGRGNVPPIDLSDLEAPRIIPRVKNATPPYHRFGSEYENSTFRD